MLELAAQYLAATGKDPAIHMFHLVVLFGLEEDLVVEVVLVGVHVVVGGLVTRRSWVRIPPEPLNFSIIQLVISVFVIIIDVALRMVLI